MLAIGISPRMTVPGVFAFGQQVLENGAVVHHRVAKILG